MGRSALKEGEKLTRQKKAELLLIMITCFWGVSYYLIDVCLTELDPLNLNAFRFLSAFAILGTIFRKNLMQLNRITIRYSIYVGLALVMVYIGATYGVRYTSLSNAGFICALSTVTTPIIDWIVNRKVPAKKLLTALLLCTVGMAMMTLNEVFRPALGDVICLLCAVAYGVDLVITERAVSKPEVDPIGLGVFQLSVTGIVMLVLSFIFETPHLPHSPSVWGGALFLGIFCTGISFVVQTVQQQYTSASRTGLIFALEPVFSAVVAYFFAGERMSVRGYFGAALMLLSLLLMEIDLGKLLRSRKNDDV